MEVINETSYNTDDLIALLKRVCDQVKVDQEQKRGWVSGSVALPPKLRIGYYAPKIDEEGGYKFAGIRPGRCTYYYKSVPRLAIVRRKLFKLSPIEHLALVAEGDMCVPRDVVKGIASTLIKFYGSSDYSDPDEWPWLPEVKVRFQLRAKRGELERARQECKEIQLNRLYTRRQDAKSSLTTLRGQIRKREKEVADLDQKIDALRREIGR